MKSMSERLSSLDVSNPPPFPNDEEIVNNILPSYEMFRATISKTLRPTNEDYRVEPPTYEVTPVNSGTTTPVCLSAMVSPQETTAEEYFPTDINEENIKIWEDTILANVHNIPNLSKSEYPVSYNLQIKTFVTKEVCQKGIKPVIIDPTLKEFKQGDFLHGYVTFLNTSLEPIPFEMVYVVFEGMIVNLENRNGYINTEKRKVTFKFLNMLDLFASWSFSNIDRLVTDNGDPHDWCEGETDPYDNTILAMDLQRMFMPGITYKRFFTFRIPEKLLDDVCEYHDISTHTEVPPTFGVPRFSIPPSQLLINRDFQIKDFALMDSSVSYTISARVIGKASDYKYKTLKDQYVVGNEDSRSIRVIPKINPLFTYSRDLMTRESEHFFKAFLDSIREKIALGNELIKLPTEKRSTYQVSKSTGKVRQLYDVADRAFKKNSKRDIDNCYQYMGAFKKKSLTGASKTLGVISLSTPKNAYKIHYTPPVKFQKKGKKYNTLIEVPFDLAYFAEEDGKLPEIKSIHGELVIVSLKSQKHTTPINISHDLCFSDQEIDTKKRECASFDTIVINKFKDYVKDVTGLIKEIGNDLIRLEAQMFKDIKALATMSSKYNILNINDSYVQIVSKQEKGEGVFTRLNLIPWKSENVDGKEVHRKTFNLQIDLKNFQVKGSEKVHDQLVLVPSFQTCILARLYYARVILKLTNGESLFVHVPVIVENDE